jgi:hypothetical protein
MRFSSSSIGRMPRIIELLFALFRGGFAHLDAEEHRSFVDGKRGVNANGDSGNKEDN